MKERKSHRIVEILAPAGNEKMVDAAILAGADAIYMGSGSFNARAFAADLDDKTLERIIKKCHLHGVKIYITVNTLLTENETEEAYLLAEKLYFMDVDALIVQDLGLIALLRKRLPEMELHASTQMNIKDYYGAKLLEEAGFSRVVLARETPKEELIRIKKELSIETEVFVHGSLCVSQSGQCYFSQAVGGRSGNRGECAQPCRKSYILYDRKGKKLTDRGAFLSPKDLNTIDEMDFYKELGVESLKIEGRMKTPEYVYTVVKNYRNKRDRNVYSNDDLEEVALRGYTRGLLFDDFYNYGEKYRTGKKGIIAGKITRGKERGLLFYDDVLPGDIFMIPTERGTEHPLTATRTYGKNDIARSKHLHDAAPGAEVRRVHSVRLKEAANRDLPRIPVKMKAEWITGKPARLVMTAKGRTAEAVGDPVDKAKNRPLSEEALKEQLDRLGNTPFTAEQIDVTVSEDAFYPLGMINALRREAVKKLSEKLTLFHKDRPAPTEYTPEKKVRRPRKTEERDGSGYREFPYLATGDVRERALKALEPGDRVLVRNLGDLELLKGRGLILVADYPINITNSLAAETASALGFDEICLSAELSPKHLTEVLENTDVFCEVFLYGNRIVMTDVFCPFSLVYKGCDRNCDSCYYNFGYLEDEYHKKYPVRRDEVSKVYFHKPLDLTGHREEIESASPDVFRVLKGDIFE